MRWFHSILLAASFFLVPTIGFSQTTVAQQTYNIVSSKLERNSLASKYAADGSLLIVGECPGSPNVQVYLYKISPAGEVRWSRILGFVLGYSLSPQSVQIANDPISDNTIVSWSYNDLENRRRTQVVGVNGMTGQTNWTRVIHHKDQQDRLIVSQPSGIQIYFQTNEEDSIVTRIDPTNGDEIWIRQLPLSYFQIATDRLYFLNSDNKLLAVSPETGLRLWEVAAPAVGKMETLPDGDLVILKGSFPNTRLYRISAINGSVLWSRAIFAWWPSYEGEFDLDCRSGFILVGGSDPNQSTPSYEIVLINSSNGDQIAGRAFVRYWNTKLSRVSDEFVFFQPSQKKVEALSVSNLQTVWEAELPQPTDLDNHLLREPDLDPTDPLVFQADVGFGIDLVRLLPVNGDVIWRKHIQPFHGVPFDPKVVTVTTQGIVVAGQNLDFWTCLLLDSDLNLIDSIESSIETPYFAGTFSNGDVLFRSYSRLARYSWAERRWLWSNETPLYNHNVVVSPLDEIFALKFGGAYFFTVQKYSGLNGNFEFETETSQFNDYFSPPPRIQFGNDGNPVLIGNKVSKIDRSNGSMIFENWFPSIPYFQRSAVDVATDGSIYLGYMANYPFEQKYFLCFKLNGINGRSIWKRAIPNPQNGLLAIKGFSFDSSGRPYVRTKPRQQRATPHIVALNPTNGAIRWRHSGVEYGFTAEMDFFLIFPSSNRIVTGLWKFYNEGGSIHLETIDSVAGSSVQNGKVAGWPTLATAKVLSPQTIIVLSSTSTGMENYRPVATKLLCN